jgi:hypothetical protein
MKLKIVSHLLGVRVLNLDGHALAGLARLGPGGGRV